LIDRKILEEVLSELKQRDNLYSSDEVPLEAMAHFISIMLDVEYDEVLETLKEMESEKTEYEAKSVKIVDDSKIEKQMVGVGVSGKGRSYLVYDTGLALDHALSLGRRGNKVFYFLEWRTRYPRIENYIAGEGFSEIIKIMDYGEILDTVDVIMFTDAGFGALADLFRAKGKRVFGASIKGEMLEYDRAFMLREFEKLGVKVPPYKIVHGVDELMANIVDGKAQFVKLNIFRGNLETYKVMNKNEMKIALEESKFGVLSDRMDFIIEEEVDGIEIGVDLFFNGKHFLRPYHFGNEVKGSDGTFGKWVVNSVWDDFLSKIEPWLAESGYRGAISFEGIYNGSDIVLLDVTSRLPYSCGSLLHRYIENYDEVVYAVAGGEEVEVKVGKTYTAQLIFEREDVNRWTPVHIEGLLQPLNIAFPMNMIKVNGELWYLPSDTHNVAVLMGSGDSFDESIDEVMKVSECIKAPDCSVGVDAIYRYRKDYLPELSKYGLEW
jgi:hypothetical protein